MLDYHLHLWPHGESARPTTLDEVAAYCKRAAEAGVTEVALTEHLFRFRQADKLLSGWWADDRRSDPALRAHAAAYWAEHVGADLEDYVSTVLEAKAAGLPVVLGLEVDYYPGRMDQVATLLAGWPFDVLLGSVHWLGNWLFDDLRSPVVQAQWGRRGVEAAWDAYTDALCELAATGSCDVLAHPDLAKVAGHRPAAPDERYDRMAEAAAAAGMAAEVSSAGWRKPAAEAYPAPALLSSFHVHGVPITTASDAHRLAEVAHRSGDLAALVRSAGYTSLSAYRGRHRMEVGIGGGAAPSIFRQSQRVRLGPVATTSGAHPRWLPAVSTMGELIHGHTELGPRDRDHLQGLMAWWGMLADLSFSDLLLLTAARGGGFVVLGQMRPSTNQTFYDEDLVGQVIADDARPLVRQAWRLGELVEGELQMVRGEQVRTQCIPVRRIERGPDRQSQLIAVMTREAALAIGRRPGELEREYVALFNRFARMVMEGVFPFAEDIAEGEEAPRVGDGVLMLDEGARVSYASPNAVNALHRMGVTVNLVGRRLAELGMPEDAVADSFLTHRPATEELERRPDVAVLLRCIPLLSAARMDGALVLLRDVTDLRRRDRLLVFKDAAIREVHHRVKNNLQTISSLLRIQARRLSSDEGRNALREAERRVRSIAAVHEILSRDAADEVPFDSIIPLLVRMAEDSDITGHPLHVQVSGHAGELAAELATPLAVIISELLQNAVEHAFVRHGAGGQGAGGQGGRRRGGPEPSRDRHQVELALARETGSLTVRVKDNGQGLPAGFSIEATRSLGLSIVRDLVTEQLGGTITMSEGFAARGTLVELRLPLVELPPA
ncbi:MAG: histidine kinase N-terminal domain-containing protein [Acidimicrobiales bacterium]